MKIGILGYGKEGQSVEQYFQKHGAETKVFDHFTAETLPDLDYSDLDLVFRTPSVPPYTHWPRTSETTPPPEHWSSITRYFFAHCPAPIIGVTGTKGKGTTSSLITTLLRALGQETYLVGNIGYPALDALDDITANDAVVYEMSSFQLWDMQQSPHIAVVLRIDPDHTNVHHGFEDYVNAKTNITRYQTADDTCIYYSPDSDSARIGFDSPAGHKIAYPVTDPTERRELDKILDYLTIPGQHNRDNAEAALLAVSSFYNFSLSEFLAKYHDIIVKTLTDFPGLPHRLQFIREFNGVRYYDDNFASAFPALDVAIAAFPDQPVFLIAGGQDRGMDQAPASERIFSAPNVQKAFLIGETSPKLAAGRDPERFQLCTTLAEAFDAARLAAEATAESSSASPIVLMSPGAPSFDMFKNFADRGEKFQKLIQEL